MKWTTKVPDVWDEALGEKQETFCATSDRGEYSIRHGVNGKFAVFLSGKAMTGFIFSRAVEAMGQADLDDAELATLM